MSKCAGMTKAFPPHTSWDVSITLEILMKLCKHLYMKTCFALFELSLCSDTFMSLFLILLIFFIEIEFHTIHVLEELKRK